LDLGGATVGAAIGVVVTLTGGWAWFTLVVVFFLLAGLFTRYGFREKAQLGVAQERGGARGWPNALANGGLAAALAVGEYVTRAYGLPGSLLAIAFVGAVATSTADTLGTELGLLSRAKPHMITGFRAVTPGTSGALSFRGLLAALWGALVIGGIAWLLGVVPLPISTALVSIGLAGLVGALVDSVLGATAQGMFRCSVCGVETESGRHHGFRTTHSRGLRWLDNNGVNVLATGAGALVAVLVGLGVHPL
jgi:uncharacterized protein (TIGR00297 family)